MLSKPLPIFNVSISILLELILKLISQLPDKILVEQYFKFLIAERIKVYFILAQ